MTARLGSLRPEPKPEDMPMADDLVFYTNPMSRGRIARWMLEEAGRPYRTEVLDFGPAMKSPAYLAINPMGKVPAIVHDGIVVTEGAAICAYLADAFPEAGLAPPPGSRERGPYYRWLFFGAGPIEAAATNKALGFEVPPEKRGMAGYGGLDFITNALEEVLGRTPFIAGERFTAADVYVGSQIAWGMMFGTLEKRPAFEAYAGKLQERPAYRRASSLDDALLPPKGGSAA